MTNKLKPTANDVPLNTMTIIVVLVVMLLFNSPVLLSDNIASSANISDAIVLVISRSVKGMRGGCGFVVGDGSLVVTAHHVVFENSEKGKHQAATLVDIASPYLGDVTDAEIIASDATLDLAILKTSWKGHPSLSMANRSQLLSCDTMNVVGIPDILWGIDKESTAPLLESFAVQSENLFVDFVAMRQNTPRFVSLSNPVKLKAGWSGAPILLNDSATVAGCFTTLSTNKRFAGNEITGRGPVITQVKELLKEHQEIGSLNSSQTQLAHPEDGIKIFLNIVQVYTLFLRDQFNDALAISEKLIRLRPNHAIGYSLTGSCLSKLGKNNEAKSSFQKALAIKPDGVVLRFIYAQFLLEQGQTDQAQKLYEQIWQSGHSRSAVAIPLSNIYSGKNNITKGVKVLEETLKENPSNAYLNFFLGNFQAQSGNTDEGIIALKRAVELLPEWGPMRGVLARTLEKSGHLDEAEKHFFQLLEIEPKNPVVHFWLAKFLAQHRPDAKKQALEEAQTTMSLLPGGGVSKKEVEDLIKTLESTL